VSEPIETVPDGWFRNPSCDHHGAVDMVTRPPSSEDGLASILVDELDHGRFFVSLNAGLFGNTTLCDIDHLTVSPGHIQDAVDLFVERSRSEVSGDE